MAHNGVFGPTLRAGEPDPDDFVRAESPEGEPMIAWTCDFGRAGDAALDALVNMLAYINADQELRVLRLEIGDVHFAEDPFPDPDPE